MKHDRSLDPFPESIQCRLCSSPSTEENTAELLVISFYSNFYHCNRCNRWIRMDRDEKRATYLITNKNTIKKLNWYYTQQFELTDGHRKVNQTMGKFFRVVKERIFFERIPEEADETVDT